MIGKDQSLKKKKAFISASVAIQPCCPDVNATAREAKLVKLVAVGGKIDHAVVWSSSNGDTHDD